MKRIRKIFRKAALVKIGCVQIETIEELENFLNGDSSGSVLILTNREKANLSKLVKIATNQRIKELKAN